MIGVTAILIATKFEEIYPLRIKTVHEKIAHRKLTVESIKQKECEFLEVLNFKVVGFSLYDSLMLCLHTINQGNLIIDSEM
jgi:AICAR transformylase/IMP cyclohydrolase PurH